MIRRDSAERRTSMKEVINRIRKDFENFWMAAAAIIVYTIVVNLIFHGFCPLVLVTGFPCPGCGITRALFYLFTGQIEKSLYIQPMGIVVLACIIYFFWNRYVIGRKAKGMKAVLGISVVLLLVVYLVRMYLYFPERVPYVYTQGCLLEKRIPYYQDILHRLGIL